MIPLPKYENKPFKPPRRLGTNYVTKKDPPKRKVQDKISTKPLSNVVGHLCSSLSDVQCFTTMYRKPSNKKIKTWTGDGYAIYKKQSQNKLVFYNESGQYMASLIITNDDESKILDTVLKSKGWEFQIDYKLVKNDELMNLQELLRGTIKQETSIRNRDKPSTNSLLTASKSNVPMSQLFNKNTVKSFKSVVKKSEVYTPLQNNQKITLNNNDLHTKRYKPIFDVTKISNPIIMNKCKEADVDVIVDPYLGKFLRKHQQEGVKFIYDCLLGLQRSNTVDVPVNKSLLLEYDSDISGCLLADDMGLGKTLMTITIIWTLLKQTPFASKVECSQSGVPLSGLCKKILIVCPVTLIGNWVKEFHKWLGMNKIGVLTLSSNNTAEMDRTAVRNFLRVQKSYQVLIVGYEKLLNLSSDLQCKRGSPMNIDLLICDEGHRLKNSTSKILNVLKELDIKRKILLSGTPIQNDLTEFYTIADFINPGIFGSFTFFKKRFIIPISKARETSNSLNDDIQELGEERSKELIEITKRFTLRRTNDILHKYLPPKTDIIIFCKPTQIQISAFYTILQESQLDFSHMTMNSSLGLITLMKKICNSPSLLQNDSYYNSMINNNEIKTKYGRIIDSGKLKVLISLLEQIQSEAPDEKVVIVSNYTQTLDIIENMLHSKQMLLSRLDGSTPQKLRDSIVTTFNRSKSIFAFLLSSKSGGVGLNLIGASRLILFDNDWNPSVDLQAMSRIHRQGQEKPCYIYRLVTTGCIDEKILQRQLMKHSLSQKFLDNEKKKVNYKDNLFSQEDLKDLFTILTDTRSNTHDLICSCQGDGAEFPAIKESYSVVDSVVSTEDNCKQEYKMKLGQWTNGLEVKKIMENVELQEKNKQTKFIKECLIGYQHIDPTKTIKICDNVVSRSLEKIPDTISFLFIKEGNIFDGDSS